MILDRGVDRLIQQIMKKLAVGSNQLKLTTIGTMWNGYTGAR